MEPKLVHLSGQQSALLRALQEGDERLSVMYLGALTVLTDQRNQDRFAQAAHSLREVMEKLPKYLDIPVAIKTIPLNAKVRELGFSWKKACINSKCCAESNWSGPIDEPLSRFLTTVESFFSWFKQIHPTRRGKIARALKSMNQDYYIPPVIEDLRVNEWSLIQDYFIGIAHHQMPQIAEEFLRWLNALESFLLDYLCPRTFEDHKALRKIISEGESNA